MKPNNRPCEVCGNSDLPCYVTCSGIGPVSFNYCEACASLGAEPEGMQEIIGSSYTVYNSNDDKYYDKSNNHIPIKLKNGTILQTRNDYIKWKEQNV